MYNVKDLLDDCNNATRYRKFSLFWWSFGSNPEHIRLLVQNLINDKNYSEKVFTEFIEVCDNRLDMAKSLLNDLSIIFSAIFVAFAAVATISTINWGTKSMDSFSTIFNSEILTILALILLIFIPVLLIWIGHLRTQIYIWASFKELALSSKI